MFSVIFEVNRKPEKQDNYLEHARHLKPMRRHGIIRHRVIRVVRDYGMYDREAPQYYDEIAAPANAKTTRVGPRPA